MRNALPPRYSLDISRPGHNPKKFKCPRCNEKRFVRFIDTATQVYLDAEYGRCDREEHCGYFRTPYEEIKAHPDTTYGKPKPYTPPPAKLSQFVDRQLVAQTLRAYDSNHLVQFLTQALGLEHVRQILSSYFIGTARDGSTLFWQLDQTMRARTAAKILYKPDGHRDKAVPPKRTHVTGDGHIPCLFGEHLLYTRGKSHPVALVESEKTAAVASAYLPRMGGKEILWIATSGAHGLTDEKAEALRDMDVILVPDFSFHARATWGSLPMRKSANTSGVRVPDPNGELVEDFFSKAALLKSKNCRVRFFDPAPHLSDSSDLADLLLSKGPPPPIYTKPDFSRFVLQFGEGMPPGVEVALPRASDVPISPDLGSSGRIALSASRAFKIAGDFEKGFFSIMDGDNSRDLIDELLNGKPIVDVIAGLGMLYGELVGPAEAADFEERCARTAWERDTYRDRMLALRMETRFHYTS